MTFKNIENIDLTQIVAIAKEAGKEVLTIYQRDFKIEYKDDNSPLTEADIVANKIICENLQTLYPNIPILSEENSQVDYNIRKNWNLYWCIDPIDGTKEFIKKNGEFTINIALIENNIPVLGVVFAPALGDIYYSKKGVGAFKNGKQLNGTGENRKIKKVIVSHSAPSPELAQFLETVGEYEKVSIGSSLKFLLLAEGKADIYPRFSPIREWDTSAGDAILREVGKKTYQYKNGKELEYNKESLFHPWFIAK